MKFGLDDTDIKKIKELIRQNPKTEEVLIYGSRAMGNYRAGSDIDLTLIGENLKLEDLNKLTADLDNLLLPYLFDIFILSKYQIKIY